MIGKNQNTQMILPWGGKNQIDSSLGGEDQREKKKLNWFFSVSGRTNLVLPCSWEESNKTLYSGRTSSGKNQNDSSMGLEEPKLFLLMIGKNHKLFLIGRTKMILPYAGKNLNDTSIRKELNKCGAAEPLAQNSSNNIRGGGCS